MPAVFFITHPDVAIDPSIPVADWPLNARGRARMQAMSASPWASGVRRISSSERKARDAAQFLADGLGLHGYSVVDGLGENDRSATGYLAQQEFEATVDAFFAQPQTSIRGWETAVDAQARIEQPATNGRNWFAFDRVSRKLLHVGWRSSYRTPL
jgi:broad specificity phosphatase PhoE